MARGAIQVKIEGQYDDKDLNRAIKDLNRLKSESGATVGPLGKMSGALKGMAVAAAAGVSIGVAVDFMKDAISQASSLAESQSKVNVVFGKSASEIMAWSKTSATSFGLSSQAALEAAGTYGNLFQAFGIGQTKAKEMSTTLVELAADLASFNNTSVEDAIEALRSGLSGETEPLKRYGVAINDARLKQEAMTLGIYEGSGALDAAQKSQAAYALILKDTSLAQGDFDRTSDGLANQQRILAAQFQDVQAKLGTLFIPIVLSAVSGLNTMLGSVGKLGDMFNTLKPVIIAVTAAAGLYTVGLIAQNSMTILIAATNVYYAIRLGIVAVATNIAAVATAAYTAALGALRIAMALALGPYGLLLAAMSGLILLLNNGAKEHNVYVRALEKTVQAQGATKDSTGKYTKEAIALGWALRGTQRSTLDAAEAHRADRAAISGTVGAAIQLGNTLPSIIDLTYDAADSAQVAAQSYVDMWNAIVAAQRQARDMANTSGTVSSAIAQGAAQGSSPSVLAAWNKRYNPPKPKGGGGGGGSAKDEVVALTAAMRDNLVAAVKLTRGVGALGYELGADLIGAFARKVKNAGKVSQETVSDLEALASTIRDRVNAALAEGQRRLDAAREAFIGYRDSIAAGIMQGNDLSDAVSAQTDAQAALTEALKQQADARAALTKAEAAGTDTTSAQDALTAADKVVTDAESQQKSFLDFLQVGADAATTFADQITSLRLAGASLEVTQKIASLGAKTGNRIITELLAGGQAAIERANQLIRTVINVGKAAGNAAAIQFYQAGIDAAQAFIDAIDKQVTEVLQPALQKIADMIKAAFNTKVDVSLPTSSSTGGSSSFSTATLIDTTGQMNAALPVGAIPTGTGHGSWWNPISNQLEYFAKGGIVTGPTLGMVGEAGPEAIIPLSKLAGMGGNTYNITVQAGVGDPRQIGQQIVELITRYERANSPVFARAS